MDANIIKEIKKKDFIEFFNDLFINSPKCIESHIVCDNHLENSKTYYKKRLESNENLKKIENRNSLINKSTIYPDFHRFK